MAPTPAFLTAAAVVEQEARLEDDRGNLQTGDNVLLIVEDDPHYARVLCDLSRDKGFKVLIATTGTEALSLAREFNPTAISLDVFLPDMLGWTVLNHLKQDPHTRHIPVQMLTLDEDRHHGLSRGAFAYVTKPSSKEDLEAALTRIRDFAQPRRKRLLLVEDNPAEQFSTRELLGSEDIDIDVAESGADALLSARRRQLRLRGARPPPARYDRLRSAGAATRQSRSSKTCRWSSSPAASSRPKKTASSTHWPAAWSSRTWNRRSGCSTKPRSSCIASSPTCPCEKQHMLDRLHQSDDALAGRKVLVVDDDVRNIFALSSVLERRGMTVLSAGTGREAIRMIESTPDLAIVLMDIMMPEMDGYETMQVIRQNPALRRLPIIALTAKAMKGDRERCLEAGASEYLAKPVNTEQLLSALRMWLHR